MFLPILEYRSKATINTEQNYEFPKKWALVIVSAKRC